MSKLTQLYLASTVILPTEKAAKIMELLSGASTVDDSWNEDKMKISKNVELTCNFYSESKFEDITKAQVLGLTYKEYLDAKRIAAECVQEDKAVSSDT